MTGKEEASYRLRVATTLAAKAEEALSRGEWREAALFARAAIENCAKAVLGGYASVPRSHEPSDLLQAALEQAAFPAALVDEARELVGRFEGYGIEQHILLSYGDEANHIDPWELVTRERAEASVLDSRLAQSFAARCVALEFGDVG